MKRSAMMRKPILLALVATMIMAWFAPSRESDSIEPSAHAKRANGVQPIDRSAQTPEAASREKTAAGTSVLQIRRRGDNEMDQAGSGLFAPVNWETAPGNLAAETETVDEIPEENTQANLAPPPFVVLGRYEDENRSYVFLQYMDETLAVSAGDIIADTYRVEKLENDTLTLLYLPLKTVQTLNMDKPQ